jgi:hypothetical protein
MQLAFSCLPPTYQGLENTLSGARLARYAQARQSDKHHALRLYVWNARLCEALYFPTQIGEVAVRNAVHAALRSKHGDQWFDQQAFLHTLPERLKSELRRAVREEWTAYGQEMTLDHLVSGLSFGFWTNLLTVRYEPALWPACFGLSFPGKPANVSRQDVYNRVDRLRIFRNKIAHHKPIFDRKPNAEFQNILALLSWICADTRWFVVNTSRVSQTIADRPSV